MEPHPSVVLQLLKLIVPFLRNYALGFDSVPAAADGMGSYMSIMSLATSLMLDFRTVIVPRFVYATSDAFGEGRISNVEVTKRVADLARAAARLGGALKAA